MENNTINIWLFLGIGLSVVSKLLQYQGKRKAGNVIAIPAAWCLLTALLFSVTDFAQLYSRAPRQALILLGIAGLLVASFQLLMMGLTRKPRRAKAKWLALVLLVGMIVFFQLWQHWI